MNVTINSLSEVTFQTASDVNHDYLDFEVLYGGEAILAFHITNERKIETYFDQNMERFVIDLGVMEAIILKAKECLYQDYDEEQQLKDKPE